MRVLHRDPRTGEIKFRIENPDDLWHLHNLLVPGDLVRASTYRREEGKADKIRPDRMEKVRVTLTVRVDKTEFQAFSDRVRIAGVIVEGPQDVGQHHTFLVGVEEVLSILKVWKPHELRRIEEAVAAAQKPMISLLALDDEEALLAQLRQYGVRELATIRAPGHGKMFPSGGGTTTTYFEEILRTLTVTPLGDALVVLGPGFTRDGFTAYLRSKAPDLAARVHVHGTSYAGMRGVHEALKAGVGAKVFEESRVAQETRLVDRVLEAIARNGPCAYGPAQVSRAIDAGAVETLLVAESAVRDRAMEDLMHRAEATRAAIVLVSGHHEAGKRLESLGAVAALLRFAVA